MCEQFDIGAVDYGEIVPGWHLLRASRDHMGVKDGDWALASEDAECWWPSEHVPATNPFHDKSDDAIDLMGAADLEASDRFVATAEEIWGYVRMEARAERELANAAEAEGFVRERSFLSDWLVHQMGKLVERWAGLFKENSFQSMGA